MLADALEADDSLREAFFSRLRRMAYAGASLPQAVWDRMQALAVRTLGQQIAFGSGYGTTETGPGISTTHWPSQGGGEIGLPMPGLTLKLVPVEGRYEVRVQGPGRWPDPTCGSLAHTAHAGRHWRRRDHRQGLCQPARHAQVPRCAGGRALQR